LTAKYRRGGGGLSRFATLLMESRDGFSANRRSDLLPSNPFVDLAKRGGTELLGESTWRGMDTLSLHVDYFFGSTEAPVGWGAAEERLRPVGSRGNHGDSWRDNPRASRLADKTMLAKQGYAGLPEIRDILQPSRQADHRLRYAVALSLPGERILTADRDVTSGIETPDGYRFNLRPDLATGGLQALSAAEIHFRRPVARSDGRQEFPSLFSPYWQVHLVDVDTAERSLSAAARGLDIDPYAVLP
jgi:hypothetical protein